MTYLAITAAALFLFAAPGDFAQNNDNADTNTAGAMRAATPPPSPLQMRTRVATAARIDRDTRPVVRVY
jgi:hypothetical protein